MFKQIPLAMSEAPSASVGWIFAIAAAAFVLLYFFNSLEPSKSDMSSPLLNHCRSFRTKAVGIFKPAGTIGTVQDGERMILKKLCFLSCAKYQS
jgi:hypothetical protein